MSYLLNRFRAAFRGPRPVPNELRPSFFHIYGDIAWFGMLSGSTMAFLAVFATRQGASPTQVGMINGVQALVILMFSLPAGTFLSKRHIARTVFWSSVAARIFYALLIPLPLMFTPEAQVWLIIGILFMMTIPNTVVNVGFNALFAETVPIEWRGHVVGIRTGLLAITTTIFSLLSGQILEWTAYPLGYQIVFTLGFIGAAMSSVHLYFLIKHQKHEPQVIQKSPAAPVKTYTTNGSRWRAVNERFQAELASFYRRGLENLRLDVLNGHFATVMALMFFWYFVLNLTVPTVTPFVVNELHIADQYIGLANGLFNLATFLGSFRLSQATSKWGNKKVTGYGFIAVATFPILLSFAREPTLYIGAHVISGFGWSMAGGALYNYVLENVPSIDRPTHLAWYSLFQNGAVLCGSLLGPALAGEIGFATALFIYGILRLVAGLALLRWG